MEFLFLFLIELTFMAVVGLLYTIPTIILVNLAEWLRSRWVEKDPDS